jgi:hypothetical protein
VQVRDQQCAVGEPKSRALMQKKKFFAANYDLHG